MFDAMRVHERVRPDFAHAGKHQLDIRLHQCRVPLIGLQDAFATDDESGCELLAQHRIFHGPMEIALREALNLLHQERVAHAAVQRFEDAKHDAAHCKLGNR